MFIEFSENDMKTNKKRYEKNKNFKQSKKKKNNNNLIQIIYTILIIL